MKWQQKCANAADRGDRVESVYTRVYSIIYRCSISMQFVGVQVFLLRVNHACETNRVIAVDNNLDKPLEAAVVELSRLLVHCSSLTGLSVRLVVGGLLVCLFVCHSCIARPSGCCSVPRASLMRRSSACLCTARPSACAPLVRLMVRLLESRSLLHRWVEGYRTSGRRGCSFGVAGDGIVKACSIESNGGSERKTAC